MSLKAYPFQSSSLHDFVVLEESEGNITRYPRTDQLPKLWKLLDDEFRLPLADKIARVNHRANDYMKLVRYTAAMVFCDFVNQVRTDNLRLCAVLDKDRIARIAIVQQSTQHEDKGDLHRFKYYAGGDFFPEVYIHGKRIAVSGHALVRFSQRVPNQAGTDLKNFIDLFFTSPMILMLCGDSPALVYFHEKSILAFPVRPDDTNPEYLVTTCLTVNEITNLVRSMPPIAYTPHYAPGYNMPAIRNWDPLTGQEELFILWQIKAPIKRDERRTIREVPWSVLAQRIEDWLKREGHGVGSQFLFKDNIPGPSTIKLRPGEKIPHHDLLADLGKMHPGNDWAEILLEQKQKNAAWY